MEGDPRFASDVMGDTEYSEGACKVGFIGRVKEAQGHGVLPH